MGEVFAGRYELVDVLAAGGAGTVWRAWDHREGCYRAAKVLRQSDGDSLLRFVRETSHRVEHPHVVMPLGWVGEDDRVLFTMPLVRGGSVATLTGDFGALPAAWVTTLLRQLLEALDAVHSVGLVHRDVKPANLLLHATGTRRPHLLLSDFGAAAAVGEPRLTRSDAVIGTPGYLAPEQLRGADPDPVQDLYGAGVVALELLAGEPPGPVGDLPRYAPASASRRELATLLEELTATEPGRRPASARAALARLDALDPPADDEASWVARGQVEVFDHVPDLPPGWTDRGPADAQLPELRGAGAAALSPSPGTPPPIPLAAWLLAGLGVLLLLVAVLLEI